MGDEPEVELLGDDADLVLDPALTTERDRSWWPLWLAGAAIVLVGIGALLTSGGGSSTDGATEVSVPESEVPAEPSTTTTEPARLLIRGEDQEGPTAASRESNPQQRFDSGLEADAEAKVVTLADPAITKLGLTGELLGWFGLELYHLDLTTGVWKKLPAGLPRAEPWSQALIATSTGFVAASELTAISFSPEGEEIDRATGEFWGGQVATANGNVWLTSHQNGPGGFDLLHLDEAGSWIDGPAVRSETIAQTTMVAAGESVFVSPFSGGIFRVDNDGTTRAADGFAITGSRNRLMRLNCPTSIENCALELLSVPSMEVVGTVLQPDTLDYFFDPCGWSPDLRHWHAPWGNGEVINVQTGETVGRVTTNDG
ncbi:MAG: hypothetical protein P8N02_06190, partial [Actinomycetota bacterium]|nr:hypothetical protein [Actinomycetota bacterium]